MNEIFYGFLMTANLFSAAIPSRPSFAPAPYEAYWSDPLGLSPKEDTFQKWAKSFVFQEAERLSLTPSGGCADNGFVSACFAPGTPPSYVNSVRARLPRPGRGGIGAAFYQAARWSYTTTNGSTGDIGTPITLTYSFVPDGTLVTGLNGAPKSASTLFATLNAQFGSSLWQDKIAQALNEWASVCGIRYVRVNDDGASFPDSFGSALRGDVRISMRNIDGLNGVLAFNYYPDYGDMVLDASENWASPANDYRFMRNILAHEHGHGHGLGHVEPFPPAAGGRTKLMEPYLATNFDGPQDDDIRGGMKNYGDSKEPNNTSVQATPLGSPASLLTLTNLSTSGQNDEDWFSLSVPETAYLNVTITPVGSTYQVGNDVTNGADPLTTVNTKQINDLEFEIYRRDGTGDTLLKTVNGGGLGASETIKNFGPLTPGAAYFVRVFNNQDLVTDDVQRYTLQVQELKPVSVSGKITLQAAVNGAQPVSFEFRPTSGAASTLVSTVLDAGGNYTLNGLAPDTYDVAIKGAKWLQKVVTGVNANAPVTGLNATLLAGDVNNNNNVDVDDLTLLLNVYNSTLGDGTYTDAADLTCNGLVDVDDLTVLLNNYNVRGQ